MFFQELKIYSLKKKSKECIAVYEILGDDIIPLHKILWFFQLFLATSSNSQPSVEKSSNTKKGGGGM